MRLPAELRLMVYERIHIRTIHATASREETGTPIIRVVLRFLDRGILQTSKLVRHEAYWCLHEETAKIGAPVQLIADCEHFGKVPDILKRRRHTLNAVLNLKEVERKTLGLHEMHFKEDKMDRMRLEIWGRLANLQLQHRNEFQIGVWIHRDAHFSSFLDDLRSTVEDTMLALPTALAVASFDWEYKHEVPEAD
jgi:hypothetical protein